MCFIFHYGKAFGPAISCQFCARSNATRALLFYNSLNLFVNFHFTAAVPKRYCFFCIVWYDEPEECVYGEVAAMFEQMDHNTVDARGQLKDTEVVRFYEPHGTGKRILFVGNSITLHGVRPEIGWDRECGMAASCPQKDYVHLLMDRVRQVRPDAAFCICQVAEWERDHGNGAAYYPMFEAAAAFGAHVIISRFVENCPKKTFDSALFQDRAWELLRFLDGGRGAEMILTTGFWPHPGDAAINELAQVHDLPCVTLGDLGQKDEMKAVGLFAHSGVACHPGDLGMQHIADRIWPFLKERL